MEPFVVFFVCGLVGWYAGDHLLQTDGQACGKGAPGRTGRIACGRHTASLTLAQAVFTGAAVVAGIASFAPVPLVCALAVNAVSHYWCDRRTTLRGLVLYTDRWLGKAAYFDTETGRMNIDKAFHMVWLWIAAVITALPTTWALAATAAAGALLAACRSASRAGLDSEARDRTRPEAVS